MSSDKGGRSAYSARWVPLAAHWVARTGATDEQIAEALGVSRSTLYGWKADHPELAEALEKGKAPIDDQVEGALLRRALGFRYGETLVGGPVERYALPDVGACSLWLRNRRPDRWRDVHDVRTGLDAEGMERLRGAIVEALDSALGDDQAGPVLEALDEALAVVE